MVQDNKDSFVIYGRQPVIEALKSTYEVREVWLGRELQGKTVSQIRKITDTKNISVRVVNKNDIQKISGPVVHQGVAAIVQPLFTGSEIELSDFISKSTNPFFIVLDQIQDPHNLGAILRTAEICGVNAVIMPEKGSAQLNSTVAKTSAGALFHLNIFKPGHLENCFEIFNAGKITSYALLPGAQRSMYEFNLKKALAVVVGSEGQGVRKNIARLCSDRISIPQFGKVDSLNASVAGAVVMYEVIRQRQIS